MENTHTSENRETLKDSSQKSAENDSGDMEFFLIGVKTPRPTLWEESSCHGLPPASLHLCDFKTSPLVVEMAQRVKHLSLDSPKPTLVYNPVRDR